MDKVFYKPKIKSEIDAVPSKSEAHRMLICAALGDGECEIVCPNGSDDIDATISCLGSLGADVIACEKGFRVLPISKIKNCGLLDCNASASTLRFLLPVAAALGADCSFLMSEGLRKRPMSPICDLLREGGILLSPQGSNPLKIKGKLTSGHYTLAADVSSQFISGMLFALSVTEGESRLTLTGKLESAPYVFLTLHTLVLFGADIKFDGKAQFKIKGRSKLHSPHKITVGGDWSNAAFFLVAGAVGQEPVTLTHLDMNSLQGDRRIIELLSKMGAEITVQGTSVTVYPSTLKGISFDASDIPDLVPALAVAASVAEGKTEIFGASRLKLKESNRIESITALLNALGSNITPTSDGMVIYGEEKLIGGDVDSFGDHRIAMSAAVASLVCKNPVTIKNFEAINKSYPTFTDNFI